MTADALDYAAMMERAVRGVVREALAVAARDGLPGQHHFYITFRTQADGVEVPERMLANYPDEMTIVLEHQFWDLEVGAESFSVTLSFGGVHTPLVVPFDAVTTFVDPSVKFGLQFGDETGKADGAPADGSPDGGGAAPEGRVVALDRFRKK